MTNFGDALSGVIVEAMLATRGLSLRNPVLPGGKSHRLLAIGSILHFAGQGDTVWGSGLNGKISVSSHRFSTLDVRAVRGPLTHAFLAERGIEAPKIYGDPALLAPILFGNRFARQDIHPLAIVPNLNDLRSVTGNACVISPLAPWHEVVEAILKSRFIVASSLHAAVVAEAYGVAARFVRLGNIESDIKYQDYLQGTGRYGVEIANSVGEAIEMGAMPAPICDLKQLMQAFPYDLWVSLTSQKTVGELPR